MLRSWFKQSARQAPARRSRLLLDQLEDRTVPTVLSMWVDPASQMTLAGTVATPLGTFNIEPQGPGSLVTNYSGYLDVDYDATAQTVTYGYNGYAFAFNSGSWEPAVGGPAGSAPAAYGGQITVPLIGSGKAAIRDLFVNGVSAPLPLTPDGQGGFNYPANQVYVYIVYGFADYYSTIGNGREDLTLLGQVNQSNTPGKFVDYGAGYYFLRAPINLTIQQNLGSGIIATLQITGNIEAWAYPAGPRPGHSEPSPDVIPALGARGSAGPLNTTPFTLTATPLATPVDQGDRQLALPVAEQEALQASRTTVPQTALEQVFSDLLRNDLVIA